MLSRLTVVLGAAVYAAVLTSVYVDRVSVLWAYEGLHYAPPPDGLQPLTWLLALLPSVWIPVGLRRPSDIVYWFLYLIVYVPTCLLPLFNSTIAPGQLMQFVICLALCFAGLGLLRTLPLLRLPRLEIQPWVFWFALALFGLACYGIIVSVSGLRLSLVSLEDVYDLRSDYEDTVQGVGPVLGYVVSWQVSLVNPLLIAYGFARRSLLFLGIGIGAQVLMYMITGFKLALFSGGIMLFIVLALISRGRRFGLVMLFTTIAIILLAVRIDEMTDSNLWTAILINRSFVLPGILTGDYFEFFTRNPQALLADSILRPFLAYPYDAGIPAVIGDAYGTGAWSNANIWADAYANFGYVGLFAFTLLLAMFLHLFDSVAARHGLILPALLSANTASILVNGALLSGIMSNGLGFMLALLYLMPRTAPPGPLRRARGAREASRTIGESAPSAVEAPVGSPS